MVESVGKLCVGSVVTGRGMHRPIVTGGASLTHSLSVYKRTRICFWIYFLKGVCCPFVISLCVYVCPRINFQTVGHILMTHFSNKWSHSTEVLCQCNVCFSIRLLVKTIQAISHKKCIGAGTRSIIWIRLFSSLSKTFFNKFQVILWIIETTS